MHDSGICLPCGHTPTFIYPCISGGKPKEGYCTNEYAFDPSKKPFDHAKGLGPAMPPTKTTPLVPLTKPYEYLIYIAGGAAVLMAVTLLASFMVSGQIATVLGVVAGLLFVVAGISGGYYEYETAQKYKSSCGC